MNLLLDTHTVIWFFENDRQLSSTARELLEEPSNEAFISIASFWEMAIKVNLRKLTLQKPLEETIKHILQKDFQLLPIKVEHTILVSRLPLHHRDPFDRILVAQSLSENLKFISKDSIFPEYGAERVW
ncbi:MAG: type II toxin-antitoxin system VapC family toxin [Bacteroidia bacterium]